MSILAWHFVGDRLRDGRKVPEDGYTLAHSGRIMVCAAGLHASLDPFDALAYAPGSTLCRVRLSGNIIHGDDKLVAEERTILERHNIEDILWEMSRWSALQVIHLWTPPKIVAEYLRTGEESLRAAARATSWDAARDAARAAAWAAAWAAARATSWDAARDAAWAAARAAEREKQRKKFSELLNRRFKTTKD